jgi:hypothetical protein
MSKKQRKVQLADLAGVNPDLPKSLISSLTRAIGYKMPVPEPEVLKRFPLVMEYLSTRAIKVPSGEENGKPRDAFAEPLLMISWDRRAGSFKWNCSNKLMNFGCGGLLSMDPALWLEEIELCIKEDRHNPRELRPI